MLVKEEVTKQAIVLFLPAMVNFQLDEPKEVLEIGQRESGNKRLLKLSY